MGARLTVMFDSGVRSGADMFKALALGARLVFVGRLWVFSLSIAGRAGVEHVMRALLADFDLTMHCAGYAAIEDITQDALKRATFV